MHPGLALGNACPPRDATLLEETRQGPTGQRSAPGREPLRKAANHRRQKAKNLFRGLICTPSTREVRTTKGEFSENETCFGAKGNAHAHEHARAHTRTHAHTRRALKTRETQEKSKASKQ